LLQKGTVSITAANFEFNKETAGLFTKVSAENYTLGISSGTLEMKDNKVIVLVD
jgi:F-type H+-transporting ATPase subunit epsilon